jgi:hypothetical protein
MHPDYINHPGHADHDPSLDRNWHPHRSPIMSLCRRILRIEREMWIIWEVSLKGRINALTQHHQYFPPLVSYIRLLRRRDRLELELNYYLP